jgi:alpha-galactosidase
MHSTLFLKQILVLSVSCYSIVSASPARLSSRLQNGLAITPPLGYVPFLPPTSKLTAIRRWNTYNHYSCAPNETIVHSNALGLVSLGLHALGYEYVTVDCGWTLPNRTPSGTLTWNPARFPSGYVVLGTFLHGLGLKFGVYSDGGTQMCMTGTPAQAGSLGMVGAGQLLLQVLTAQATRLQMRRPSLLGEPIC